VYRSGPITIIAGDLFDVNEADVGAIDAIYDRAALIALPPDLRRRYIDHLRMIVPALTRTLLVGLEYEQARYDGPPFSVLDAEVRSLYDSVELIDERLGAGGPLAAAGLTVIERCYVAHV